MIAAILNRSFRNVLPSVRGSCFVSEQSGCNKECDPDRKVQNSMRPKTITQDGKPNTPNNDIHWFGLTNHPHAEFGLVQVSHIVSPHEQRAENRRAKDRSYGKQEAVCPKKIPANQDAEHISGEFCWMRMLNHDALDETKVCSRLHTIAPVFFKLP
ncbi:MAG TPA: hypothetical protein VGD58_07045 [Herpetosiphonaceae bacterium]